ncbi:enolase [Nanobdella aerobiophila]|uniref:phosphopyruvate hydratase n=1 Tax=Nanobdella aerobiophila TaxID=2586965 RepID=A0A915WS61_9ARCH|nr:enolase [Nanobdella aerobiophila]BBL45581.1 enolase [Nanobdella aerobiophila]
MEIKSARARVVLNSRGDPTIEVEINKSSEAAPEGASKGKYEAPYIDPQKAVELFNNELVDFLKTFDIQSYKDLEAFESEFESIGGIKRYGANTLIATEFAILRAWSNYEGRNIYEFFNKNPKMNIKILANVIGGGAHAKGRSTNIQEFLISPDTNNLPLAIFVASYIHKLLGKRLELLDDRFLYGKDDEGAWTTFLDDNTVFNVIKMVFGEIKEDYNIGINIGIDLAASQLYKNNSYQYKDKIFSREEQIKYVKSLIELYDLFYVEDPIDEEDFDGFAEINNNTKSLIVGDDLTVTNTERIKKALVYKSIKGVIIKPNQIGSVVKAFETVKLCKENNLIPILSHRSGETDSNIIADIAVGFEVPYVKFGIVNGERIAKLNRLIRIYQSLNK